MDRHPLAGGDDADDVVARQRVAAAGEVVRHARHQTGDRHVAVGALAVRRPRGGGGARAPCAARAAPGAVPATRRAPRPSGRDCRCRPRRRAPARVARFSVLSAAPAPSRNLPPRLAERLGDFRPAGIEVLLALLRVDEAADAGARLAGDDEAFPLRVRRAAAGGHDLDLVAVLQLVAQRHAAAR